MSQQSEMREILFRGKRLDNGDWVEGFYCHLKDPYKGKEAHYIYYIFAESDCGKFYPDKYEVDPNTIGQYTGLTDKNGVRIFEGDVLNTTNPNCAIWIVDYKLTAFCANQRNVNYSCVLDDFMECSEVEVIGNIHDNPELLEGGDEK